MSDLYWWSRYATFAPGEDILPHMGEVIAYYRKKRGYKTQADFAIAAGVATRAVQEWETAIMTHDHGRRIFLAKMLRIPPALLGLDWRLIAFTNNKGEYDDPLAHQIDRLEEDSYYAYDDILIMGHEYIHNGGPIEIADRIERRLRKLVEITKSARATDKEAWKTLLCRYYQLSTRIKQQCLMDDRKSVEHAKLAIELAQDLQDVELLAAALVNSACTFSQQGNSQQAQEDIAAALTYVDRLRNGPLKGNIYLESANINTPFASDDRQLQKRCIAWQDKAFNLLYRGSIEPDESFFRFNLSAIHHERAKSLLRWQKTASERKAVRTKLAAAFETLNSDLNVWKAYYYMTEAKLSIAEHDLEASALAGKEALKIAQSMHSKMEEANVRTLYTELDTHDSHNPYVRNLGLELGIY